MKIIVLQQNADKSGCTVSLFTYWNLNISFLVSKSILNWKKNIFCRFWQKSSTLMDWLFVRKLKEYGIRELRHSAILQTTTCITVFQRYLWMTIRKSVLNIKILLKVWFALIHQFFIVRFRFAATLHLK